MAKRNIIGSHLLDYNKRLRLYLDNTQFGTELPFIEMEMNKVRTDIISQREIIDKILSSGNPGKIQGTKKGISSLNYHSICYEINTDFLKWLEDRKSKLTDDEKLKRKELTSYHWLTNPDKELLELYKRMNGKFIAQIDFPAFGAIFTGQPVTSITNKLKWLKSSALLAYFIDSIGNHIAFADFWSVAKYCFENADSLKQSKQNYLNNKKTGKPQGHNQIDDLLTDL